MVFIHHIDALKALTFNFFLQLFGINTSNIGNIGIFFTMSLHQEDLMYNRSKTNVYFAVKYKTFLSMYL